ncbi:major facilitator superfamily domain-containing protein [Apiospora phragmitis]|uniref:Major facilitator superfamily domain-containing protein n=1 Tax=Apiospora phragmitis TaxID=2905665 RepID=A0ABR1VXV7_9PEZI
MAILNDYEPEKAPQANTNNTSPSVSDRGVGNSTPPVDVQQKPKRSWKSYIWDTFGKSPEERRFLFKLDLALMTLASLGDMIYVLRFFIGRAESTFYPGMQYIIGSWYRKDELAKRSCLFHAMGKLAGSHSLNGVNGWHGWQWLFITNTVVSLPIALAGFFFLPGIPEITTAWYFTPDEIAPAKKRMHLEGRATRQPFTRKKIANIFSTWHIYMLVLLYIVFNNGNGGNSQPAFQLWLKREHYGVREVNLYPTLTEVISIVTTLIYAWTSDTVFRGARCPPIVFSGLVKIVAYGGLTAWDISDGLKWACFLLCGFGGGTSGLAFACAHEICSDDTEKRAVVTGSMNMMAYVFQVWLPLLIWQQVEAPQYPKGYSTTLGLAVLLIATAFAIRFLHKREIGLKCGLVKAPV